MLNISGQGLMFLQVLFSGSGVSFTAELQHELRKWQCFSTSEKRIVSVKQLELESWNLGCSITAPLWNSWCAWMWPHEFRWQSQCSWGMRESESGSALLQNASFTQQKQGVEAIASISRRKPLLKRRAWNISEKQPFPVKILSPSQAGRILNLCAGIQTARSFCPATAALLLWAGPRSLCIFKALMPNLWGSSSRDLARSGNLANMTPFLELKRTRWYYLLIAWPLIVQI